MDFEAADHHHNRVMETDIKRTFTTFLQDGKKTILRDNVKIE